MHVYEIPLPNDIDTIMAIIQVFAAYFDTRISDNHSMIIKTEMDQAELESFIQKKREEGLPDISVREITEEDA